MQIINSIHSCLLVVIRPLPLISFQNDQMTIKLMEIRCWVLNLSGRRKSFPGPEVDNRKLPGKILTKL